MALSRVDRILMYMSPQVEKRQKRFESEGAYWMEHVEYLVRVDLDVDCTALFAAVT